VLAAVQPISAQTRLDSADQALAELAAATYVAQAVQEPLSNWLVDPLLYVVGASSLRRQNSGGSRGADLVPTSELHSSHTPAHLSALATILDGANVLRDSDGCATPRPATCRITPTKAGIISFTAAWSEGDTILVAVTLTRPTNVVVGRVGTTATFAMREEYYFKMRKVAGAVVVEGVMKVVT
jgi:hypothetical protein